MTQSWRATGKLPQALREVFCFVLFFLLFFFVTYRGWKQNLRKPGVWEVERDSHGGLLLPRLLTIYPCLCCAMWKSEPWGHCFPDVKLDAGNAALRGPMVLPCLAWVQSVCSLPIARASAPPQLTQRGFRRARWSLYSCRPLWGLPCVPTGWAGPQQGNHVLPDSSLSAIAKPGSGPEEGHEGQTPPCCAASCPCSARLWLCLSPQGLAHAF